MQVSDIPLEIQANLVKALKQLLEKDFHFVGFAFILRGKIREADTRRKHADDMRKAN